MNTASEVGMVILFVWFVIVMLAILSVLGVVGIKIALDLWRNDE